MNMNYFYSIELTYYSTSFCAKRSLINPVLTYMVSTNSNDAHVY